MSARILKQLTPQYFGKTEDSGLRRFVVKSKGRPDPDTLYALGLGRYSCNCTYDCCGHLQFGAAISVRNLKRDEWYVVQPFCYNI